MRIWVIGDNAQHVVLTSFVKTYIFVVCASSLCSFPIKRNLMKTSTKIIFAGMSLIVIALGYAVIVAIMQGLVMK